MPAAHAPSRSPALARRPHPRALSSIALLATLALAACHASNPAEANPHPRGNPMKLTTTSFQAGQIPRDYTCDGTDRSPQLTWTAPPDETRSLALLVTDPDAPAGTWVHWVLFNLPADTRGLPEGLPTQPSLPDGSSQGQNDFGRLGYGGPCPPRGSNHRYVFDLYALDAVLKLQPGATRAQVEKAMQGHILGRTSLTARYGR